MSKTIHIYYINRIKDCLFRIFEAEDEGCVDYPNKVIARNNHAIDQWLKKAGITDKELERELLSEIDWCWNKCVERLEALGWTILRGKENL